MNLITTLTRRKPLLWIGSLIGLLLLVIATLALYVGTRSDEWWRDLLTATLSQRLGREVEIQGAFRLDLGRRVTTEAASVRIGNPDWSESGDMLRLGSLLLEFDLLSSLGDTLLIHRLELADIELALEEDQDGKKNWEYAAETKPTPARKPGEGITLPVRIEQLSLQRAQLSLNLPRWERPLVLQVDAITGGRSPDDKVVLDGSGRLGDLPFSFSGGLGTISSMLNAGPVSYHVSGTLGKASLHSKGSIDSLAAPLRPQLDLVFSGPDIMQITQAMGAPKIAEGPFEARIDISPGGRGISGRIRCELGTLQLHADISAEDLDPIKNMDVTARLSGENLAALSDLLGLPPLPKGSFEIDAALQNDNNITRIETMTASVGKHRILVKGVVGAWPELKNTRLELHAEGPDLAAFTPTVVLIGLGQLPAGAYTANALIEPGEIGLHVRPSSVIAGGYQATAEGHLFTRDQFRAELNVTASGPDLSMVTRLADTILLPAWPFQARGRIDITGKDITIIGASGTAGKHKIAVDGPIAFSTTGPLRLDVTGSGPSLQAVLQGLGYDVIPAPAAYQVEGRIEITNKRLVVTAKHARLGPTEASAVLSIPDVNTPTTLMLDVHNSKTSDISTALALAGVKLDLPQVVPALLSGQIKRTRDTIGLTNVRGTIGTARVKVDGTIGDPPNYENTRVNLDISGSNLEHFLGHPVEQAVPFQIKGSVARDKEYTRFEDLKLKLDNIEANVHGQVGNWEHAEGTELTISAEGANLDALAAILDRPLPAGAVKFDGHVRGTEDAFHIDRMNAQLGSSDLSGDLKLIRGEPPRLKGQVNSTHLDFALFQKKARPGQTSNATTKDTRNMDPTETDEDAQPQKKQRLLFPDTPIKLEVFDHFDLDLEIRVDEVVNLWELDPLRGITAGVLLKGRTLSVSDFEMRRMRGGKVKGDLAIGRDADLTRIDVDITGEQLRFDLAAAPGQRPETYPPADIEAKFTGAGSTYRTLAASLDGRIKGIQGEGRINNNTMGILLSDVLYELFQSVNPLAKTEPSTKLNCGVYIINLADGKAEIQAVVIQTDKLTIVSAGTIDLNTERINIGFETRPRIGAGISASAITNSYIRLGGSMAKPAITLDPGSATLATGAAVATGGLSFVLKGVWDRYLTARDPCGEALKRDAELQTMKARQP
jgi:uncharacterized protein involved in outer membrane biogenesis